MDNIEFLRTATEAIDKFLEMSTGLSAMERKIVAYYTLATHTVIHTNTFPLLVLIGPMGTGKSQTLGIVNAFAYRPHSLAPRGYSPAAIRDELVDCHNGTAIIEEADAGWKDSGPYEALLSDRYGRESAKAAHKVPIGDGGWDTRYKLFYGATVAHKRIRFADAALEGRSITVNFKPKHGCTYKEFPEKDPVVLDLKKRLATFIFSPPELQQQFQAAGRILNSFRPTLALAELCADTAFLEQVEQWLATKTDQLKEDQSIEPDGLVVRALVERLSTASGFVFPNVKMKDLRTSIFGNYGVDLQPRQIAGLCRDLGFQTKNSHGFTVVVPTAKLLVATCARIGYEDEEIAKLREQLEEMGRQH